MSGPGPVAGVGDRAGDPPVRLDVFRQQLGEVGIEDIAEEAISMYVRDARARLDELAGAVRVRDAAQVTRLAHALKSASLNVWALGAADVLERLEDLGESGELDGVDALHAEATAELHRVFAYLDTVVDQP